MKKESLTKLKEQENKAHSSKEEEEKWRSSEKQIVHIGIKWSIVIFFGVFLILTIIRATMLIIPKTWIWLDDCQINELDYFIFGGGIVGMIQVYTNRYRET